MPKQSHPININVPLVLASRSPRRRSLLSEAGYRFEVVPPDESAESGVCSGETSRELVARLATQKAADVAPQVAAGVVIGCDTLVECRGQVLGKPRDQDDARRMLLLLRGNPHHVHSGLCLWRRPNDEPITRVDTTSLTMEAISDERLDEYLDTDLWEGKAGAFGFQDRHGWIHIVEGSESNVVGLPMELFGTMLAEIAKAGG